MPASCITHHLHKSPSNVKWICLQQNMEESAQVTFGESNVYDGVASKAPISTAFNYLTISTYSIDISAICFHWGSD